MKPNGLVLAASMTSHTSMSILWHISASSFTMPMFTARNVFSSSFTISATRVELTLITRLDDRAVEQRRRFRARRADAADDLRNVPRRVGLVARIDPLGRKREEEVDVGLQALGFEHRLHDFVGRARIRRRLEDDQLAGLERLDDRFDGLDDVRQIRILRLPERRRHADVDDVHAGQIAHAGSSRAAARP